MTKHKDYSATKHVHIERSPAKFAITVYDDKGSAVERVYAMTSYAADVEAEKLAGRYRTDNVVKSNKVSFKRDGRGK